MDPFPTAMSFIFFFMLFSVTRASLETPFHPRDVLPFLPKEVSWPVLNYLNSAVDLLPTFVGAASASLNTVDWKGACFYQNQAWIEFHNKTGSQFGGGTLHIKTLEKWVSGAYAGHSAVCLRDSQGKLWVGESGHENEEGEDIVAMIPWEEWWEFELNKDDSNPHIALLPLRPEIRAKFNGTAAWEYALSMNGKPYGYHNMIFSWIDTISGNFPPPLDAHLVASVMTIWSQMQPTYAANMWNEALNKRLGTEGLDLSAIIVESEKRGSSFAELLTIPEQDDWVYSDGKSTSCIAFILEMYKEAGLFDPISSSIQVTEFTIKDAYTLNFFETDASRLPSWCNDGDDVKLPYCQIRGQYRMELPGYNTMEPYPHMNEKCPSLPPDYLRTQNC
ncbi:hypothetical protein LINPERPRIM_LOCUS5502 [Linum perenne]